jgi:hypothetical protein
MRGTTPSRDDVLDLDVEEVFFGRVVDGSGEAEPVGEADEVCVAEDVGEGDSVGETDVAVADAVGVTDGVSVVRWSAAMGRMKSSGVFTP